MYAFCAKSVYISNMNNYDFANLCRQLRMSRSLTIKELSVIANVGTTAISNIESKGHVPRPKTLGRLEKGLNLDSHESMLLWAAAGLKSAEITEQALTPLEQNIISMLRTLGPDYAKEVQLIIQAIFRLRNRN